MSGTGDCSDGRTWSGMRRQSRLTAPVGQPDRPDKNVVSVPNQAVGHQPGSLRPGQEPQQLPRGGAGATAGTGKAAIATSKSSRHQGHIGIICRASLQCSRPRTLGGGKFRVSALLGESPGRGSTTELLDGHFSPTTSDRRFRRLWAYHGRTPPRRRHPARPVSVLRGAVAANVIRHHRAYRVQIAWGSPAPQCRLVKAPGPGRAVGA